VKATHHDELITPRGRTWALQHNYLRSNELKRERFVGQQVSMEPACVFNLH
jgi:hypothetical protein